MVDQREIADRFLDFAVGIVKLADKIAKSPVGRHIAGQITRSATSAGANYQETCFSAPFCLRQKDRNQDFLSGSPREDEVFAWGDKFDICILKFEMRLFEPQGGVNARN